MSLRFLRWAIDAAVLALCLYAVLRLFVAGAITIMPGEF